MTVLSLSGRSNDSIGRASAIAWILVLIMLAPVSRAEEGAGTDTKTTQENLRQRSAEERWQRIKKQYPTNPNAPRRSTPGQLPADSAQTQGSGDIPPSPSESMLIPRMTSVPPDHSNDWIIPSRQPDLEDDLVNEFEENSRAPESSDSDGNRSAQPPVKIAAQDPAPTPAYEEAQNSTPPRALHERKISDIAPFYDRDRDEDIRKFATEKGREVDIEFRPKPYVPRSFPEVVLAWEVSNYYYHPLYFSDPALERYGHSHHPVIQPLASIARAGFQFVFLPYQMVITPVGKYESTLGFYRPGDVAPKLHYQVPLNAEAAAVETGFVTGLYFMIVP